MRVIIKRPIVVGPLNSFGETPIVASAADGTPCATLTQVMAAQWANGLAQTSIPVRGRATQQASVAHPRCT